SIWAYEKYASTTLWVPHVMSKLLAFALERRIEVPYVEYLIRTRNLSPPSPETETWPWPICIRTLGPFELLIDGKPLPQARKTPRKLVAALKLLVALGAHHVPEKALADALWSDQDGDVALDLLATALHRLGKLIGDASAIELRDGRISLKRERVWLDTWAF